MTTAPEVQRQRIMARGNMTAEALDAILARQLPDAEKRRRADFVVDTSHGLDPVFRFDLWSTRPRRDVCLAISTCSITRLCRIENHV
jgi:Dephospho-CoA kinase